MDEIQSYLYNEHSAISEKYKKRIRAQRGFIIFFLTAAAIVLYLFHFRLPMLPKMFVVELSAFPELLMTFAYGPLYGVAVCLLKNAVHILVTGNTIIPDTANFIIESLFLLVAGAYFMKGAEAYSNKTFQKPGRGRRIKLMLSGSLAAVLTALAVQFVITVVFVYPALMEKYSEAYSPEIFMQSYQAVMNGLRAHLPGALASLVPRISHIWQGVLFVNLPVTLMKLCAVTLLTVALYSLLLPVLYVKIPKLDDPIQS